MNLYISVAIGGAAGALCRYMSAGLMLRLFGSEFPYGTLFVNVLGSFLMGCLIETMALKWSPSPEMRLFLVTGFLGAFTTFSTFSLDVALQIEKGAYIATASYILLSVALSIGGLFFGLYSMRTILS